ncbi:MAG: hypothetical protein JRC68_03325 [Deltaproteobacteria bacterium]|nr:hypothetical protein [Deltaproteobacteria bacterium]
MKESDIYKLFSSMAEDSIQNNQAVREVFSALIRSTLRYRDHMLESDGVVVTVEDVRAVLDWLVPTLNTGRPPQTDNKIRLDLLKLWLDELRYLGNTGIFC